MTKTSEGNADHGLSQYAEIQYVIVQFLTEHLADCRQVFGGDLDAVLVLAVIGQRHISAYLAEARETPPGRPVFSMSASRIADVSGMPRETVRRKLAMLQQKGWVQQNSDATWAIAGDPGETKAQADLSELDQRGMARALRFHAELGLALAKVKHSPR